MKLLSFCLVLLLICHSPLLLASSSCESTRIDHLEETDEPSYIIVMEEEVMLVTETSNPQELISSIEVYTVTGIQVLSINGCLDNQCTTNLSFLSAGQYLVTMTTMNGTIYSKVVQIG